ncbi:hypothetical protein JT358_02065 [Micrococcales bacterium 31B]|nr:hypothetical protein [Micrococcales bacterium 31B]
MSTLQEVFPDDVLRDFDLLLGTGLEQAKRELQAKGQLKFFAVVMSLEGEVQIANVEMEDGEDPYLVAVEFVEGLKEHRDKLRAIGLVATVKDPATQHVAVRCDLEFPGGKAVSYISPYQMKKRRLTYEDPIMLPFEPVVWHD